MKSLVKKYTALMMALLMAAMLCACGSSSGSESEGLVDEIPAFTSIDLEGNEVDESIFQNADVTVVNFWGTFCGPCINEMPELAEWDKELPDNVQIIGVVTDVASKNAAEFEDAKEIVSETGVKYTNVIIGDQFGDVSRSLVGVPTTFFVDKNGKCVAEGVIGADVEAYKQTVEGLI